jgi:hypothetical protein
MSELLTQEEHDVVQLAGELWGEICRAIPDGPTREADLRELIIHVHAIQHAVMANAAARAYPETYRSLGMTLDGKPTAPPELLPDPSAPAERRWMF